ncbi:hypothetical protein Dform_00975 [Dehalogenimonas formicexedens]|uniref:Uncharacterized protein n=1 Tax=Dehalogenimonas formicexedens TaxID=1839801 RepID=A0A1P8F755_9CHLR|nr:hypothetical protein [Dehalogenimonas formicexedens]APV44316.1 hypothetical protein Dform_00975 [Dehalogenimonas formicexedens]
MGILSMSLGIVSLFLLGIGTATDTRLMVVLTAVPAIGGIFSGLAGLARKQKRAAAWGGVAGSSIALVAGAIIYGIGHNL